MHLIQSILTLPIAAFLAVGNWVNNYVLGTFSIGMTAKQILEEQLGVYGVLAFLIYKLMRLLIDAYPLFRPNWLQGDLPRISALIGLCLVVSYLVTCAYLGLVMPLLQLEVGAGGLLAASLIAWVALGYHYIKEKVDDAREAKEAAEEQA
ncbi:MAG TPA: hypothetical protein VFA39_20020 [Steroidobacteraceae bacterium]|nr:hypothetical protein [Steroidobacteraceae bacterium]